MPIKDTCHHHPATTSTHSAPLLDTSAPADHFRQQQLQAGFDLPDLPSNRHLQFVIKHPTKCCQNVSEADLSDTFDSNLMGHVH